MTVENPMLVSSPTVPLGDLSPGDTFVIAGDPGSNLYLLLGGGFTASSGGVPIARPSDGAMGPNVNAATPVIPVPYNAAPA